MISFKPFWLVGAPLAILSSCQGTDVRVRANTPVVTVEVDVEVPDAGTGESEATTMTVYPDPSMFGLCASATVLGPNGHVSGPPSLMLPGPNSVEVPPGMGPPSIAFWPWEKQLLSGAYQDPAALESYYYAAVPWSPVPGENVYSFLELEATSRSQADLRHETLDRMYQDLLQGIDPGPLPSYVKVASYSSWHSVDSGPDAGDIVFTAARPGTQVDHFRLELNDFVATLGNGATAWTMGDWQVVEVTVPRAEVHFPSPSGPVTNGYRIVLDTDVGDALPNDAELTMEFLQ